MKLKTRLAIAFLVCGLAPMILSGLVSHLTAIGTLREIETTADDALQQKSEEQMIAVREIKGDQIEKYFAMIRNQVLTFSHDKMIVDAMREIAPAFHSYVAELQLDQATLGMQKQALGNYYEGQFGAEYARRNEGEIPPTTDLLERLGETATALQYAYIAANDHPLGEKHHLDSGSDASTYSTIHQEIHPIVREYLTKFGYYDIFLVDSESGNIVYSVYKELDYGTSLLSGPYADTNIAEAFRQANEATDPSEVFLVDFEQYLPSYEAPASFIASPVFDGSKKIGVAIFQMPIDEINAVMTTRAGLGQTGETFLVGPDCLMRSDAFHDPDARSIEAAFHSPDSGRVDHAGVRKALAGETGIVTLKSYNENEVICAYMPVELLGHRWAILAEIERDEACAAATAIGESAHRSTNKLLSWNLGIGIVSSLVIIGVGLLIARFISQPLNRIIEMLKDMAQGDGDLTKRLDDRRSDEFGELGSRFNLFVEKLSTLVSKIAKSSSTLSYSSLTLSDTSAELSSGAQSATSQSGTMAAAAEEMSVNMSNIAKATQNVSDNVRNVATSMAQMDQSIGEVATNAERSAHVAGEAADLVQVSNQRIGELGNAANEIGKVIEVIQDIAEQTNLLALNATIEAARAGEAGKGFGVVATEVKELAKQTAAATDDIRNRIEGIQASTGDAVKAIAEISEVIQNVNDVSRTIAAAVEEQSITTKDIAQHLTQTSTAADTVATGVKESATASQEITQGIGSVDQILKQTAEGAQKSQQSGDSFNELAQEMQALVGQFKVEAKSPTAGPTVAS